MRTLIIIPVLLIFFSLSISSYAAADYNKGITAAQNGDFATALKEWKPLAELGYGPALYNLGVMYAFGHGVPQDYKEAARLYQLAAEGGHEDAQYNLGVMYERGNGVPLDVVYAYMWFNILAANGDKDAEERRNKLNKTLSQSQVQEAQRLTRECVKKNYKGC